MRWKVTGAYVENGVHVVSIQHYWWVFRTSKSQWAAPVNRIGDTTGAWQNLSTCEVAGEKLVTFIKRYINVQGLIDKMHLLPGEKELDSAEPVACSVCGRGAVVESEMSRFDELCWFQVRCHHKYLCMQGPRTKIRAKAVAWWNVMNGHVMQDFVEVLHQPDPKSRDSKFTELFANSPSMSWLGLNASKHRIEENVKRLEKLQGNRLEDVEAELKKLKSGTT